MNTTKLLGALTFCGLAALLSCDGDGTSTSGNRLSDDDCPIGTFKPEGFADCVIPADDPFGNLLGVSDNRCATGQPAFPPVCASDVGGRPYFSTSMTCAPNYRFQPGACQRNGGGFGGNGGFMTGIGTGNAGRTGLDPTGGAGVSAGGTGPAGATGFDPGAAGTGGQEMTGGGTGAAAAGVPIAN